MTRWLLLLLLVAACKSSDKPADKPSVEKPHHHEDRNDPATAPAVLSLDVVVDDGVPAKWGPDAFAKAPHFQSTNNGGESRDAWSLRELAHALVGPNARVVSVTGDVTKAIDANAWNDAARIPIIHTTRRGSLKFRWTDAAGAWGDTEVKDVTKLEIATH